MTKQEIEEAVSVLRNKHEPISHALALRIADALESLSSPTPEDVAQDAASIRKVLERVTADDDVGSAEYADEYDALSRLATAAERGPGLEAHNKRLIDERDAAWTERDAARERAEALEQSERDLSGHVANLEKVLAAERESLRLARENAEGFRNERDAARQDAGEWKGVAAERLEQIDRERKSTDSEIERLTARVAELERELAKATATRDALAASRRAIANESEDNKARMWKAEARIRELEAAPVTLDEALADSECVSVGNNSAIHLAPTPAPGLRHPSWCKGCVHPPHLGLCTGRNGQTAHPCPCIHSTTPEAPTPGLREAVDLSNVARDIRVNYETARDAIRNHPASVSRKGNMALTALRDCALTAARLAYDGTAPESVTHAQFAAAVVERLRALMGPDGFGAALETHPDARHVIPDMPFWKWDGFIAWLGEYLGLTLPTGPGGGEEFPHVAADDGSCALTCPACLQTDEPADMDPTPRARIAPTPEPECDCHLRNIACIHAVRRALEARNPRVTPEGPALVDPDACGDCLKPVSEHRDGGTAEGCETCAELDDALTQSEPAASDVVWEAPGSVRVVGPVGEEHAEVKGRDGEWYEANVGGWVYVLARALAEAKRESASRLLLWEEMNKRMGDVDESVRKAAEDMREQCAKTAEYMASRVDGESRVVLLNCASVIRHGTLEAL